MPPKWKLGIGTVLLVREMVQPLFGFISRPHTRYRDYTNPHLYVWINLLTTLIYLVGIAWVTIGTYQIWFQKSKQFGNIEAQL